MGPSFAAGRYAGSAWNTGGPGLPHFAPALPLATPLRDGSAVSILSSPAASALRQVDIDATVVEVKSLSQGANGMISLGVGAGATLATAANNVCCSSPSGCACPPFSGHPGQKFVHIDGGLEYAGLTGGTNAASVVLLGESLQSYCGANCLVGQWVATGTSGGFASGGAGLTWTMTTDETADVNYNSSAQIRLAGGVEYVYRGTARVQDLQPSRHFGDHRELCRNADGRERDRYVFGRRSVEDGARPTSRKHHGLHL